LGNVEDYQEFEKLYADKHPEENVTPEEVQDAKPAVVAAPAVKAAPLNKAHVDSQRKEWLNKLHIFQRYREVREEHALENWRRHSVEWHKIEQHVSESVRKVT
jgi:hypothetical protein